MVEDRESAPPVAPPDPAAPSASRAAEGGLALYVRALLVRVALLAMGLLVVLAARTWSMPEVRLAVAIEGMAGALTTLVMMVGLNRFARTEEDERAGGLAIVAVIVLVLDLVCGLYGTKLRLDMATEAADVVLVAQAFRALPYVETAGHALGLGSAIVVLAALHPLARRLGNPKLGRRIGGAASALGVVAALALIAPLATTGESNGAFAYEVILVGAAAAVIANYVAVIFAVRRAMRA